MLKLRTTKNFLVAFMFVANGIGLAGSYGSAVWPLRSSRAN